MKKDMTLYELRKYIESENKSLQFHRHALTYEEIKKGDLERQVNEWQEQFEYVSYLEELALSKSIEVHAVFFDPRENCTKDISLFSLEQMINQIEFTLQLYKRKENFLFSHPEEKDEDLKFYIDVKEKLLKSYTEAANKISISVNIK